MASIGHLHVGPTTSHQYRHVERRITTCDYFVEEQPKTEHSTAQTDV
jgi:hypothetical protein